MNPEDRGELAQESSRGSDLGKQGILPSDGAGKADRGRETHRSKPYVRDVDKWHNHNQQTTLLSWRIRSNSLGTWPRGRSSVSVKHKRLQLSHNKTKVTRM